MNAREREVIAHHECGHGVVATLLPSADPVSKISIIPRSRGALGYTMQMPKEDRYLLSQQELEDQIAVMLAGRAAERLRAGTGVPPRSPTTVPARFRSPNRTEAFRGIERMAEAQSVGAGCRLSGTSRSQTRHIPAGGIADSGIFALPSWVRS